MLAEGCLLRATLKFAFTMIHRATNGGTTHDLMIKIRLGAHSATAITTIRDWVATKLGMSSAVPPVVGAAGLPGEPLSIVVAVHDVSYHVSRVTYSELDSDHLVVLRERATAAGQLNASAALDALTDPPIAIMTIGVSAVSAAYMAELWAHMGSAELFCPHMVEQAVWTRDGINVARHTTDGFSWERFRV